MPQPPARRSRRFLSENSPTPEAASEGDEEGGMPPRQPRLAWQETWSSRGSNRPAEDSLLAVERTPVEAFLPEEDSSPADAIAQAAGSSQVEESQDDVQWLDPSKAWKLCRDKAVEFIRAYVRGTEKDDEEQKMLFLSKICDLCTCVTERGVPMNLHGFCSKHKLVENIMALLEKEPMDSLRTAFRQKAMETVALLRCITDDYENYSDDEPTELYIPILGQLLGILFIFTSDKDSIRFTALETLSHIYKIIRKGRECILREDMLYYAVRHKKLEYAKLPFSTTSTPCEIAKGFGGHLFPDERLDIILTALEALQDSSIHDKQGACSVLDAALEDPFYWLKDVPKTMECIRRNLGSIHTALARQCLDSLLLQMTKKMSREEVKNLLQFSPPRDSTDLAMWEVILAMPQTLERVLNIMMQDLPLRNWCTEVTKDTCIRRLAMLAQNHISEEDFVNPVHLQSYLRHPRPMMRFLVLKGLCTVSESPEKAREIQVLLPDILEALQDTNTHVVLKALLVLKNVMAHVERRKASGPALQLAEKLLPFFDHESSHMREHSICLFQTVVEAVLRQRKKEMKRTVHRSLLPLYFHMRDQSESVAKASGEALAVTAEFLRCKELKRLAQTEQTWRIGECLLQQDRGRVEEYLQQSQPYLQATQTDLRLEAVRFIGLAARYCEDQSEEKLNEILRVLRPSEKDPEPMVRSGAVETTVMLTSRHTATSGRRFPLPCCR
ncbi:uncharacterized protein [Anas platyrhynchos]|uniref:uncharacterized protein n=1 Tax=Anas platyrhynchos TaxID=8839 RepID=UPI003AF284EE